MPLLLQPGASGSSGAILKLALIIGAAILVMLLLVALAGPLLLILVLILAAVAVVWLVRRGSPSAAPSIGIFAALRLLCILLRNLPKLGNALTLTADGMQAAASGISVGRNALDRVEGDLDGAGTLLKTVTFPVPSPQTRSLRELLDIPGALNIGVIDQQLMIGLNWEQKKILTDIGDLLMRQATAIRTTSAILQMHIDALNGAAQPLREVGQALKSNG